jgi:hypothetical protein
MYPVKIVKNNLLSCWPDGYSRYYSVSNILRIVFENKNINILDVGGDSGWMSKFLNSAGVSYKLKIIDIRKPDFINKDPNVSYIKADFFNHKLVDFIPDAVINTDVLEHIPKELKMTFVNKCIESASSLVIFSAPHDDPEVTLTEHKINNFYLKYAQKQQPWLKEHFEFGKPNTSEIENTIKKAGYRYLIIDTNSLENWFISFSMNFINSELIGLKGMDNLNRIYNENIHSVGDFKSKPYRKQIIVFKNDALFIKYSSTITDFFVANDSKRIEYFTEAFSVLLENINDLNISLKSLIQKNIVLKDKLIKSTASLASTRQNSKIINKQLKDIKASKLYRFNNMAKKILNVKRIS